ncbi:MAG: PIG-L family deacetylase, partial [Rhodoglobus sp.]
YMDSGFPEGTGTVEGPRDPLPANCFALVPLEVLAEPLVRIIRELRPQVMVTYDENGGYPHPDHIRTHQISMYAAEAAADPKRYPEQGPAWRISKIYYDRTVNSERVSAMYEAMVVSNHPARARLEGLMARLGERPSQATTHIPVADFLEIRDDALRAHASQVPPDSPFFFWPNDLQREVWPFEDFQLVQSSVESVMPEDDLFAGLAFPADGLSS